MVPPTQTFLGVRHAFLPQFVEQERVTNPKERVCGNLKQMETLVHYCMIVSGCMKFKNNRAGRYDDVIILDSYLCDIQCLEVNDWN